MCIYMRRSYISVLIKPELTPNRVCADTFLPVLQLLKGAISIFKKLDIRLTHYQMTNFRLFRIERL